MRNNKAIAFDLGNVIFPFSHLKIVENLSPGSPFPPDEIFRRIFESGLEKEFDLGHYSPEEFFFKVKTELELEFDMEKFKEAWNSIFTVDENVVNLMLNLKKYGYPVYVISNTNELHYKYLVEKHQIMETVDGSILSFKVGARKPDPIIFRRAVEIIGLPAEQVVFTDDKLEFVKAAEKEGMKGIKFEGALQLAGSLTRLGFRL